MVGGMAKWAGMCEIFPLFFCQHWVSFISEFSCQPVYWNRLNVITVTQRWARDVQGLLRTNEPNRARWVERLSNKIRWCGKCFSTLGPNPDNA